jgi:hypothetical protein
LYKVLAYVPAPLGMPLSGGWGNVVQAVWFTVLALTYKDQGIDSPDGIYHNFALREGSL